MRLVEDLSCQEFVELVTDYLEGALPEELCASFEAHLEVCDGCRLYLGQMRLTIRALREPRNGSLPPSLQQTLLGHFNRWHAERHVAGATRHEPRTDQKPPDKP